MRLATAFCTLVFLQCTLVAGIAIAFFTVFAVRADTSTQQAWDTVVPLSGAPQARHESGVVELNGKVYLLGGRGMRAVQVYDPATSAWTDLGPTPLEVHHFQPVAVGNSIYVIASFTCCYPSEPSIADIHVFDTTTNTWSIAGAMPVARVRGSAGVVVRDDIIYVVGGNTLGHSGGAVDWFDSYDPSTGDWTVLPDAPNARDHFAAVLVDDYLVAAAGRQTTQPNPFNNAVAQTDLFDFATGTWSTVTDIPTVRAGALAAAAGHDIIVAGGEINTSTVALSDVEAMNVYTGQWRSLQPMAIGRHSGGGVAFDGKFHVIAGSQNTGGAPETDSHETLTIDETAASDLDADGLSNTDERSTHGTDPTVADTDLDLLSDGDEINQHGTNPLVADTDDDGLSDGDEVSTWLTDPTLADSDADGLIDLDEVQQHMTDPNNPDSDSDGVNDGDEVAEGTSPTMSDNPDDEAGNGTVEQTLPDTDSDSDVDLSGDSGGDLDVDSDADSDSDMESVAVGTEAETGSETESDSGNVSTLFLCVLLVGCLARIRLKSVKVTSKKRNNPVCY